MINKKKRKLLNKRVSVSVISIAVAIIVISIALNLYWQVQDERDFLSKRNAILAYIKEKKNTPYSGEDNRDVRH
jgi:hypothetical protein